MRLLRHDFRRVYHCCYDEVETDEAIDLIVTLPRGSRYVASRHPELSWDEGRVNTADVIDAMWAMTFWGNRKSLADAPTVTRPEDIVERRRAAERAASIKDKLENGKWEAV